MFDLHIHSTFSDGSDTVEELIENIHKAKIDYFSITDHDTALSARTIIKSDNLKQKISDYNMTYVTGTEWTCDFDGYSVHILSYDFDPFASEVLELETEIKNLLKEKNNYRFEALREKGYIFSQKSMEFLNSRENVRKLDLANSLVNDGYFPNIQEAIDECLRDIKYPRKYKLDGRKVVETLSKIGAKMVWAHSIHGLGKKPISYEEIDHLVFEMKKLGLAGLECYYSLYDRKEIDELIKIAKKYDLFLTSGSDYHGRNKTVALAELSSDGSMPKDGEIIVDKIFKNAIK